MGKLLVIGAVAGAVWLWAKAPVDPRKWPQALKNEIEGLKAAGKEAVAAGKQAAARREEEFDKEVVSAGRR